MKIFSKKRSQTLSFCNETKLEGSKRFWILIYISLSKSLILLGEFGAAPKLKGGSSFNTLIFKT